MASPCALGSNCPLCRAGVGPPSTHVARGSVVITQAEFEKVFGGMLGAKRLGELLTRAAPHVSATSVAAGIVHARAECTHDVTRDILSLCLRFIANEGLPRLEP